MLKSHFNLTTDNVLEEDGQSYEETVSKVVQEMVDTKPKEKHLHESEISVRLSMLGKTADGGGYTYLKVNLNGLHLTNINRIKGFEHLQFVDVSNNRLNLEALQVVTMLPSLVLLQADKNNIQSAALKPMNYFQILILNDNQLTSVHDVYQPELATLEVGNNSIEKIHFEKRMTTLRCLDFRNNLIRDITGLNFPILDSLYLAGNRITSLVGLNSMPNLRILHVRNNPIRLLDGFGDGLTKLQYINLRNCKVGTLRQLRKLKDIKALEVLILKGTPYMGGSGMENYEPGNDDDPELRVEVLATLPRLNRINKGTVTAEERTEAKTLMLLWINEGDKDEDEEYLEEEEHPEDANPEGP